MLPHIERMLDEQKTLRARMVRLREFMLSDVYLALPAKDQDLLYQQHYVMGLYRDILEERIERARDKAERPDHAP